jgi:hypothetical protein
VIEIDSDGKPLFCFGASVLAWSDTLPPEPSNPSYDFIVNEGIKWKFPPEWDVSHIVDFKELELGWQIEVALYAHLNLEQLGDFVAQREGVQA